MSKVEMIDHTREAKRVQELVAFGRRLGIEVKAIWLPPYKRGMIAGVRLEGK